MGRLSRGVLVWRLDVARDDNTCPSRNVAITRHTGYRPAGPAAWSCYHGGQGTVPDTDLHADLVSVIVKRMHGPLSVCAEMTKSGSAQGDYGRPVMPPTGSSRIVAALASSSVGTPHGPVILDGEAGRGSRRRGERELRPGCLDAAEARGRPLGRPGARRPRAIGGTGTSPGSSSSRGSGWRRLGARHGGAAARRARTLA